jgi:hypothetical protein
MKPIKQKDIIKSIRKKMPRPSVSFKVKKTYKRSDWVNAYWE